MTTVKDALIAARAKIEKGWTQGAYARDTNGKPSLNIRDDDTTCWCMAGALVAAVNLDTHYSTYLKAFDAVSGIVSDLGAYSIPRYNDAPGRTQAEVLAVFDLAIEKAQ